MPRIRFTTTPKLARDLLHLGYREGVEVDLSDNLANRWLRRGVAVTVDVPPAVTPVAAPVMAIDVLAEAMDEIEAAGAVAVEPAKAETPAEHWRRNRKA